MYQCCKSDGEKNGEASERLLQVFQDAAALPGRTVVDQGEREAVEVVEAVLVWVVAVVPSVLAVHPQMPLTCRQEGARLIPFHFRLTGTQTVRQELPLVEARTVSQPPFSTLPHPRGRWCILAAVTSWRRWSRWEAARLNRPGRGAPARVPRRPSLLCRKAQHEYQQKNILARRVCGLSRLVSPERSA